MNPNVWGVLPSTQVRSSIYDQNISKARWFPKVSGHEGLGCLDLDILLTSLKVLVKKTTSHPRFQLHVAAPERVQLKGYGYLRMSCDHTNYIDSCKIPIPYRTVNSVSHNSISYVRRWTRTYPLPTDELLTGVWLHDALASPAEIEFWEHSSRCVQNCTFHFN